jgi:hypothetical protein
VFRAFENFVMVRIRSFGLLTARVAAVGFSLAVLVWLVVGSQRRANGSLPVAPPQPPATTADAAPIVAPELPAAPVESVPDMPVVELELQQLMPEDRIFLPTSKSADLSELNVLETIPGAGTQPQDPVALPPGSTPVFLPSSKVLAPGTIPKLRPALKPGDLTPSSKPAQPKP